MSKILGYFNAEHLYILQVDIDIVPSPYTISSGDNPSEEPQEEQVLVMVCFGLNHHPLHTTLQARFTWERRETF